jgi:hypothetical protein
LYKITAEIATLSQHNSGKIYNLSAAQQNRESGLAVLPVSFSTLSTFSTCAKNPLFSRLFKKIAVQI